MDVRYRQETASVRSLLMPFWLLRSHMAFLVDSLLSYLQVQVFFVLFLLSSSNLHSISIKTDVLQEEYEALQTQIAQSHSFDIVRESHDRFLRSIIERSFLNIKVSTKLVI